jgi:hypothetical protein
MVICICDVIAAPKGLNVIRLIEQGLQSGAILIASPPLSHHRLHPTRSEVYPTNLVIVSIGHIEGPFVPAETNGMLEEGLRKGSIRITEIKEAFPHEGFDGVVFHVSDGGAFAVCEVEAALGV